MCFPIDLNPKRFSVCPSEESFLISGSQHTHNDSKRNTQHTQTAHSNTESTLRLLHCFYSRTTEFHIKEPRWLSLWVWAWSDCCYWICQMIQDMKPWCVSSCLLLFYWETLPHPESGSYSGSKIIYQAIFWGSGRLSEVVHHYQFWLRFCFWILSVLQMVELVSSDLQPTGLVCSRILTGGDQI